ncbi:MAG TPA: TonB-dependent receptor [Woeseiaceae bacterium]|nr:TonB-dependent receptor [Woeseiaceae bacterium]
MSNRYFPKAWRAAALPVGFLVTGAAFAQESAEPVVEEVIVTGTRIMRGNLTQPNPVYGLNAEEVKLTGQLNLVDVVDDLPQLFSSQNSAQSDFFAQDGIDNTAGLAQLDLRSLGPNRTLVLVDGRRHVSGQAGTASVDIGSIPGTLVERVEVLTGGASSIYGADAVSGVVNFIMKDNFEGTEVDVQGGLGFDDGGGEAQLSLTHGRNFLGDRLNITVNATVRRREDIRFRDRDWAEDSGIANVQELNWRRFFQNADDMPAGAFLGAAISATDIEGNCIAAFPGTDAALLERACNARPQSIEKNMRFGLSSPNGLIAIALAEDPLDAASGPATSFPLFHNAGFAAQLAPGTPFMDFNANGVDDCDESYVGALAIGGCVIVDDAGVVRPLNPGIVDGDINFDSIGSDGSPQSGADDQVLDPMFEQAVFNALVNFDLTEKTRLFSDLKYVTSETRTAGGTISFEDTINISRENPFVPQELTALMDDILALNPQFTDTAQFLMSRDSEDIHRDTFVDRETFRLVAGIQGDFWDSWSWEGAVNYGRTNEDVLSHTLLPDRYFASLDVVLDANGNPVCRSEVDPDWTLDTFNTGSIFDAPGINTFTPGDGSCVPGNPFGRGNFSTAAQDFIAPFAAFNDEITQKVLSVIVTGDSERWFTLPAGAIGLAAGVEYREEESESIPDAFEQAGFYFNSQTSAISGEYSVTEFFVETSVPLLAEVAFARELTVDAAYRLSDYDLAVGQTNSWSGGFSWTPIEDLRFRGTISRAVRAPNIFELFSPQTGANFNLDIDPCDQDAIDALAVSDPATAAQRAANCAADPLVGPNFQNPLTSNFPGVQGGNPDLTEETSDTTTFGIVVSPRFLEGLTFTVDRWEIEIEDAIALIDDEDILRGCYDGSALDPTFCDLFTRISDPTSGFFGGLNFLQTGQVNYAALETSGYDAEVLYDIEAFGGTVSLRANATYLDELVEFRSVLDPTLGDDEKGEMQRPEWAGNFNARFSTDRLTIGYYGRYMGNQLHRLVEENEAESFDNAWSGSLWVHDLSGSFAINDSYTIYGGIQNISDEDPFITQPSFPTGTRGRYLFFGVTATL